MATQLWLLIVVPVYAQGKEYSVKYGSKELYGILSKPNAAADKRQGIVILAHGFGGTHHFAYSYFEALNKLGYQAYAFDFAGGSPMSRSDKNTMNMSVLDQQRQLETVVEHFRSQPDIDPKRIVLLGESQGGLVSALTAASIQKKINRLVLIFLPSASLTIGVHTIQRWNRCPTPPACGTYLSAASILEKFMIWMPLLLHANTASPYSLFTAMQTTWYPMPIQKRW